MSELFFVAAYSGGEGIERGAEGGDLVGETDEGAAGAGAVTVLLSRVRLCGRTIESVLKESPTHGKTPVDSAGEEAADGVECAGR